MRRGRDHLAPELAGARAAAVPFWRIGERVGAGATAEVYRAERDGVVAALKVASGKDVEALEPVGHEAALVASLERRWGPALLDAGRVPAGVAPLPAGARYVATTWVEGRALDAAMSASAAKTTSAARAERAAVVAHAVGRALDELHATGRSAWRREAGERARNGRAPEARSRRRTRRDVDRHGPRGEDPR